MTTLDILLHAALVTSFIILRFGIPVLLTWTVGQVLHRLPHA